jgi:hypothetical protein
MKQSTSTQKTQDPQPVNNTIELKSLKYSKLRTLTRSFDKTQDQ